MVHGYNVLGLYLVYAYMCVYKSISLAPATASCQPLANLDFAISRWTLDKTGS